MPERDWQIDWVAELEDFMSWLLREQDKCVPQGYCGQSMFITTGRALLLKKYSNFQDAWKTFREWQKEAET